MASGWSPVSWSVGDGLRPGLALLLVLALTTGAFAEPRCRIEREADARLRLQVWAQETTTKSLLTARAFHVWLGSSFLRAKNPI